MNHQTRQLVALLADDVPARLIEALQRGALPVPQLVRQTGASERTITQTLELLLAHGIVEWEAAHRSGRGRPSRAWRIAATEDISAFERACEELRRALLNRGLQAIEQSDTSERR